MTTQTEQDETARLRADIDRTRAELAGSVDALAAKFDVPQRVRTAAAARTEPARRAAESLAGSALGLVRGGVTTGVTAGISVVRWTTGTITGLGTGALRVAGDLRRRVTGGSEPQWHEYEHDRR